MTDYTARMFESVGRQLHSPPAAVPAHCNVCGIELRTASEDLMGMCERCAGGKEKQP